ncbi:protein zer-1 homolog [Pecten maximus]|uniref:protein zer-1 homolog n=1 Tax=Pecten maximus TaxID=6579 RepID=UPI001458059D|nr:protein zer-1 homolog [Pecten maximus]
MMSYQLEKENGPDTLLDMCVSYCMNNMSILVQDAEESGPWDSSFQRLQPGLNFPTTISDNLFNYLTRNVSESWNAQCQDLIPVFSDTEKTPLTKVMIRQQIDLSEPGSQSLFNHPLNHLELTCCSFCDVFSYEIFQLIKKLRNSMRALKLWTKPNCLRCGSLSTTESVNKLTKIQDSRDNSEPLVSSNIVDLRLLSVQNFKHREFTETPTMLKSLIEPLHNLCHLNLTGCGITEHDLDSVVALPKITYLVLSGIQFEDIQEGFVKLGKASRLKHLDISCSSQDPKIYPNAVANMTALLTQLCNLTSLDISGTNLPGDRLKESVSHKMEPSSRDEEGIGTCMSEKVKSCDSFGGRHFAFLGLWNCPDLPFSWNNTPADQFSGWENDDQILFSASVYLENEKMLTHVLNRLFGSLRVGPRPNKILDGVPTMLKAIQLHPLCREIQRSAKQVKLIKSTIIK